MNINEINLFVRVDASKETGDGHFIRCFTLANRLKNKVNQIIFISNKLPLHFKNDIKKNNFKFKKINGYTHVQEDKYTKNYDELINNDIDATVKILMKYGNKINWLLVDHYGLNDFWEKKIRKYVKNIIVIDDLADRKHDCDILIDQNYHHNKNSRYMKLIPCSTIQLLGPKYAIIRPQFNRIRKICKIRNQLKRILISFGGTDPTNETKKALLGLCKMNDRIKIDVVVGKSNPNKHEIKKICLKNLNCKYYEQIENISKLMKNADLAIGGGGTMTWERCSMGLPTIIVSISKDQENTAMILDKKGCATNLGSHRNVFELDYQNAIKQNNSKKMSEMSKKCFLLVDGEGVNRIVDKIVDIR